jgi:ATP-dependent exoDNAse (exonuclease V) beta subunit
VEQLSIDIDAIGDAAAAKPARRLTDEQLAAVRERSRAVLLSAAAGSGKTSVLVERFVEAVREDGIAPASVLAITFTERAAGELRSRIRGRLLELGEREAARDTEAAFIGTFHGFCARLLRAHPLPAGLDPGFEILDAARSRWLRRRAFEEALADFLAPGDAAAVDVLAAYGVDKVRDMVEQLHAELRSRGERRPRLPVREPAGDAGRDEVDALATVALLDILLGLFGDRYEAAKERRLAVDFDDLELIAGELLEGEEALRSAWAERFELLMVDEFQDTNPRQLAILRCLERENLFTVGDELQSIYGFRHADVGLFRARRDELAVTGGAMVLRSNFRSREEVLDAVGVVFCERLQSFAPLVHARDESEAPTAATPVELLLTDAAAGAWRDGPAGEAIMAGLPPGRAPARAAEARLLAQRVRELIDAGEARAGDVAVLLRASGDIETFERALQLQGLRTLPTVGTFWDRQQITDLHAYLRALANPRDEEALYGTLASPLVGISRDGLAQLALAAASRRGRLWETVLAVVSEGGEELAADDRGALARFAGWLDPERAAAGEHGISVLIERAIAHGRYVEHVRGLDWPERRLANIHKLLRVARAFEASEGRDLRAFVDHVEELRAGGAIEPEAPVEDVEPDTVRLMTIHAAKGLEFPVVCVADLGRRRPTPDDRLFVNGPRLGLRLWRPGQGEGIKTLEFDELRSERQAREREEEGRVFYVAMTRARERLLLSGAVDFSSWPKENGTSPPISWLGPGLIPSLPQLVAGGGGISTVPAGEHGAGPPVRVTLSDPSSYGAVLRDAPSSVRAQDGDGDLVPSGREAPSLDQRAPSAARGHPVSAPTPAPALPATLSYSSLTQLERCGYRWYLERVLRMPEDAVRGAGGGGLEARARGILVHRLLELHRHGSATAPDAARVVEVAAELGYRPQSGEADEIAALIAAALASPLGARIARARARRIEHPFAFALGPAAPLVTGVIDVLCEEADGTLLVVDYKSDRLEPGAEMETLVRDEYAVQRLLYALAVLREGAVAVEVAHWFLVRPSEPALARYAAADRPTLEEQLAARVAADWADPFAVSAHPGPQLCAGCPGRGGMCSWSLQETTGGEGAEPSGATGQAGAAEGSPNRPNN